MTGDTCNTCVYFKTDTDDPRSFGLCRRRPPTVVGGGYMNDRDGEQVRAFVTVWPEVAPDDGCGEHQRPAGAR